MIGRRGALGTRAAEQQLIACRLSTPDFGGLCPRVELMHRCRGNGGCAGGGSMVVWRSLAACALCAFVMPAHAAEEVMFSEPPPWVVDLERTEAADFDADLPAHVRLTDFQSRLEAGKTSHYISVEIEIRKAEGLAAGNLSLSWQ